MLSTIGKRYISNVAYRSKMFIPTLGSQSETQKNVSQSLKLMLKAGIVRQSSSGIFMLLPEGKKIMDKIENVIDENLPYVGAQKMQMPILLNKDLWEKTGRWENTNKEMFKLKDSKNREYCLGPTHEEMFTKLIQESNISYKSLPLLLYQNGTKYRDEFRPRGGLMRAREFLMNDMYSFHIDERDALLTYRNVTGIYADIFNELHIPITRVDADGGNICNNISHEFMYINTDGEDQIAICDHCGYSSNLEVARCYKYVAPEFTTPDYLDVYAPSLMNSHDYSSFLREIQKQEGIDDFLNVYKLTTDKGPIYVLMALNEKPNPVKIQKSGSLSHLLLNNESKEMSSSIEIIEDPIKIDHSQIPTDIKLLLVDGSIPTELYNHIHKLGGQSVLGGDYRYVQSEDVCNCLKGNLHVHKATELGHTFFLGDQYSSKLGLLCNNKESKQVPLQMGCYGIGMSRVLACLFDLYGYGRGMILPNNLSPYHIAVIDKSEDTEVTKQTMSILDNLTSKDPDLRILYDDRKEVSISQKIKDSELSGCRMAIIIGNNYIKNKNIELKVLHSFLYDDINIDQPIDKNYATKYNGNILMSNLFQNDWEGIKKLGFFHGSMDCKEDQIIENTLKVFDKLN